MAVERKWCKDEITSDQVGKKEIIVFLQEYAAPKFLQEHRLMGSIKNVTKTAKKDNLIKTYEELFDKQAFKGSEYDVEIEKVVKVVKDMSVKAKNEAVDEGPPKFKKVTLKKGDKANFPKQGDKVTVYYIGKLQDGTVFDTCQPGSKKKKLMPLCFKVGNGSVIRGWEEGLLQMSVGEKAEITIEPEWAYGKKGKPEAKIPPNSTLIFEVDLVRID